MGRSPCCEKLGLKKGPWTPEEDQKLLAYIEEHGHGNWRALPTKAGLQRCGKSCRLRWTNYLRPDIKRGKFSLQEEQTIIQLHALLGNRWSAIATHLPKRTDNEIKNYWNTHLKKRLTKMGIDPVTHKPKNDALLPAAESGPHQSKNAANLSHLAQWESARLEAEARLVRQSKLRSNTCSFTPPPPTVAYLQRGQQVMPPLSAQLSSSSSSSGHHMSSTSTGPRCLDVLKPWHNVWPNANTNNADHHEGIGIGLGAGGVDMESPTSTLSFMGNGGVIEFMGNNGNSNNNFDQERHQQMVKEECDRQEWKRAFDNGLENSLSFSNSSGLNDVGMSMEVGKESGGDHEDDHDHDNDGRDRDQDHSFMEGFTELLLSTTTTTTATTATARTTTSTSCGKSLADDHGRYNSGSSGSEYYEDNKNYWNSILHLVNSTPPDSPMF